MILFVILLFWRIVVKRLNSLDFLFEIVQDDLIARVDAYYVQLSVNSFFVGFVYSDFHFRWQVFFAYGAVGWSCIFFENISSRCFLQMSSPQHLSVTGSMNISLQHLHVISSLIFILFRDILDFRVFTLFWNTFNSTFFLKAIKKGIYII